MTAYTPSLPALITALPGDETRAPQTEFTRERQVPFLENLSVTGSVRSAAAASGVSHQSAYRARRATGAFRTAWDAALVVARANAEATLAARAIDGVEEEVRYRGEVVGSRTRFSDRLLLAHLGRLDRLAETPDAAAFAADFEGALARFARGEEVLAGAAGAGAETSPEPCNTWSMSPADWEAFEKAQDQDTSDWDDEAVCAAQLARIYAAMEAERPADAPRLDADDPGDVISSAQFDAFEKGVPRWWLVVDHKYDESGRLGRFIYANTDAPAPAAPATPEPASAEAGARDGPGSSPGPAAPLNRAERRRAAALARRSARAPAKPARVASSARPAQYGRKRGGR